MTTRQLLIAVLLQHVLAFHLETDIILDGLPTFYLDFFLDNLTTTEPTLLHLLEMLQLLTCESGMVRLLTTALAKALLTCSTPDTVLGHVDTSLWAHQLSFVILRIELYLAFCYFHYFTAWAFG